ncbi:uncharacterized protein LOC135818921 [Sycon ciliatum]|uniref:uncharacterized protein LOC135818921 n=1 Tax=Sycon ciliatum TaxID=27933 RepID=UPI0031F66D77
MLFLRAAMTLLVVHTLSSPPCHRFSHASPNQNEQREVNEKEDSRKTEECGCVDCESLPLPNITNGDCQRRPLTAGSYQSQVRCHCLDRHTMFKTRGKGVRSRVHGDSANMQCLRNCSASYWASNLECRPTKCLDRPRLPRGSELAAKWERVGYDVNTTLELRCEKGFSMNEKVPQPALLRCTEEGYWVTDNAPVLCQETWLVKCTAVDWYQKELQERHLLYNPDAKLLNPGESVTFNCSKPRMRLVGKRTLSCSIRQDGTPVLSDDFPRCVPVRCDTWPLVDMRLAMYTPTGEEMPAYDQSIHAPNSIQVGCSSCRCHGNHEPGRTACTEDEHKTRCEAARRTLVCTAPENNGDGVWMLQKDDNSLVQQFNLGDLSTPCDLDVH